MSEEKVADLEHQIEMLKIELSSRAVSYERMEFEVQRLKVRTETLFDVIRVLDRQDSGIRW